MLHIKDGVTPRNLYICAAVANVAQSLGITVTITSGTDGTHMTGSKHYTSEALDIRLVLQENNFISLLRQRLGPAYQVILEKDHVHVEYDPAPTPKPLNA